MGTSRTPPDRVRVSGNDQTRGFLDAKLVAGAGVVLTELSDGGAETLEISSSAVAGAQLRLGEAVVVGDVLTVDAAGDMVRAAAGFAGGLWRAAAVALAAGAAGATIPVALPGAVAGARFGSAPAPASNGQAVFLSATTGEVTLTPLVSTGNVVYLVGTLQGADGVTLVPAVIFQTQYISRVP